MKNVEYSSNSGTMTSRSQYLQIVKAALLARKFRFASEAVLKWLASYPGDLTASLYYGQALLGDERLKDALLVLEGLCMADPEYVEAAETLSQAERLVDYESGSDQRALNPAFNTREVQEPGGATQTYVYALTGQAERSELLAPWGEYLWEARRALEIGDLQKAESLIQRTLTEEESLPLAHVTHLRIMAANPKIPLEIKRERSSYYHNRWPDCLACMLLLAVWSIEAGDSDLGVTLLHQAVARDVSGQVVTRLWGESHPFRSMWPERLERRFDLPIPSQVAAILGWNRLTRGLEKPVEPVEEPPIETVEEPVEEASKITLPGESPDGPMDSIHTATFEEGSGLPENTETESQAFENEQPGETRPTRLDEELLKTQREEAQAELHSIGREMERLGSRMGLSGITGHDGRYPIYVILSVRSRLQEIFGQGVADALETEMRALVSAVQGWSSWGARLFLADDPACTLPLGIQPVTSGDPWELKHALADMDKALAKRGERIGALLIVGGPEVVPFHHLPNPVDDQDVDVPSDNPYATRDKNYFVPEWPVGRVPCVVGDNGEFILGMLRRISLSHTSRTRRSSLPVKIWQGIARLVTVLTYSRRSNFGYSAAIWRAAASSVFQPIGKPKALLVSPPLGLDGPSLVVDGGRPDRRNGNSNGVPSPEGRLGYFNLHGLVDASEWFGQRDPLDPADGPDYPVALRPQDIGQRKWWRSGDVPEVVFSEACYGLHIQGRSIEDTISLKFLEAGSQAVIGSSCMSYGSIGAPLIAADLLGQTFWQHLKSGMPAGEALRQAKINLAQEMQRRQGYLDGEDQKTLISFILYGDPLAQPVGNGRGPKSVRDLGKPIGDVRTVCDRSSALLNDALLPPEAMMNVRQVVARYLPGMSDAQFVFAHERVGCKGEGHTCPTSQLERQTTQDEGLKHEGKTILENGPSRSLVTLHKQVVSSDSVHEHYARLTVDDRGKVVKLVVSR